VKVLFVLDSLYGGGTERSTAVLLPLLRERGVEAVVVVLRASTGDQDELANDGFEIIRLEPGGFFNRIRSLRRLIREHRPDVVHTALFTSDILGRIAGIATPAKVVSSLVNTPYDRARMTDPNINRWKLRAVQAIDAVTARIGTDFLHSVSAGVADDNSRALRYPRRRIIVVDRGRARQTLGTWSEDRRARVRKALGVDADTPLVITAGRQEYQKAHADLIAAAAELQREIANVNMVGAMVLIAGRDGNASTDVQQALRLHNAEGFVTLLGDRNDVADLMVAADVFCLSSRWEGTAGAALEAMALRCPIVSTDVSGLRGVLEHGHNSILVEPNSPSALAAGLIAVLTDNALANALREQGESDFENRFTIERSADEMHRFYALVISGDHSR
jgi:glycosyltransferase involved in cell wall biosynthesis